MHTEAYVTPHEYMHYYKYKDKSVYFGANNIVTF